MESKLLANQRGFYFKFPGLRVQNIRTNMRQFPDRVLLAAEIEQSLPKNRSQLLLNSNDPCEFRLGVSWLHWIPASSDDCLSKYSDVMASSTWSAHTNFADRREMNAQIFTRFPKRQCNQT
jgi:hypothetical protein